MAEVFSEETAIYLVRVGGKVAWAKGVEGGTWLPQPHGFSQEGLSPDTQASCPFLPTLVGE